VSYSTNVGIWRPDIRVGSPKNVGLADYICMGSNRMGFDGIRNMAGIAAMYYLLKYDPVIADISYTLEMWTEAGDEVDAELRRKYPYWCIVPLISCGRQIKWANMGSLEFINKYCIFRSTSYEEIIEAAVDVVMCHGLVTAGNGGGR